eukprot:scaffold213964_cov18-Tisochrysis_lutea.AAC.1
MLQQPSTQLCVMPTAAGQHLEERGLISGPCMRCSFVFCRQRQDNSLRRGGEQLSVVVLSEFPFSSPLTPLSQVAGPLYFSMGAPALKQ